ncbi:PREDICTED: uncharacterized protein LOC108771167 [Trachymyrmex cornetzi]|uniref:uncharacterized protein LOC108771167 n=1 Tax=Trachymyrmex cornetzi TaxID=471704 RepID=UPI00084F3B0A|nr:PREDICTED: uncharacterized protein LOC108771167 [Trachymyrmex cornetzi]
MSTPQLLTSALIYIGDHKNILIKCRALLDTCSTANFISESLVIQLGIPVVASTTLVGAINTISTESKAADPDFHLPRPVDLLIGSGATLSLLSIGQVNLSHPDHDLYLQKTRLGWVVAGSTPVGTYSKTAICHLTNLENQIVKFWAVEEIEEKHPKSKEEIECETHFIKTTNRTSDGRYIVSLPFRNTGKRLGESRSVALKRFLALERKFDRDAAFKAEYTRAFEQYLTSNHISVADDPEDDGYYMPHHAIFKDSSETTKIRIVFDASAKTNTGLSLNDALMVGPTIQNTLFAHLIRFRTYKYAITADIEKMYLQVLVHENERKFQRVLWRKDDEIKTFQLNTLAFGVASSPFLTIRTLQQLAEDECHAFPEATKVLKTHLYVDNLLSGANTIDEARLIRDKLIDLLARGGFNIRQWASNEERIINDLPTRALHASLALDADGSLKTRNTMEHTQR